MALNIDLRREPVGSVNTKFGELFIFRLSMGEQTQLHEDFTKSIKKVNSEEFVRKLIRFVCYRKSDLLEGKFKPEEPCLSSEEIDELSEDEIEDFAREYIKRNQYLYKESKTKAKKNEKGDTTFHSEFGKEIHPKIDGETNVEYLQRLSIIERDNQRKQVEKMVKPFSDLIRNSMPASEKIKDILFSDKINQTLAMGDSLKKTIDAMRPDETFQIHATETYPPQIDFAELARKQEEQRREPFNELSAKLGHIIDASVKTADFTMEMNKIQKQIADELEESGKKSRRFSITNIFLSVIIILLTVIALILSCNSINNEREYKKQDNETIEGFLEERNSLLNNNLKKINNLFEKQNQIIAEFKLMREIDQKRFGKIEDKIRVSKEREQSVKE